MSKAAVQSEFRSVVAEHRRRLDRLIDRRGAANLKKIYDDGLASLEKKIAAAVGRGGKATMSTYQIALAKVQIRQGQAAISKRLSGALGEITEEAQEESLRAQIRDLKTLERRFNGAAVTLPIEEAARFRGVIDKRRTSLLRAHETSMNRYGARAVGKMEETLSTSLVAGDSGEETIGKIMDVAGNQWHQAERIVRTETSWAYSATARDGMIENARVIPELKMRWNEHVSDAGVPFDDRVGVDSVALHGQVTHPGGLFTCPSETRAGEDVPEGLEGETWEHPPNRPNDRAVLAPWRKDWGVPGWEWRGRRVSL